MSDNNNIDNDNNYFYEYEFRGEQLRRLRCWISKEINETDKEYENRILQLAYKEDIIDKIKFNINSSQNKSFINWIKCYSNLNLMKINNK
jgi:hypothetical protein